MKTLFFGMLLCISTLALGQQEPYQLPVDPTNTNIIPPAPETWAFTQYGEYPVSRETGVPNISIPLHTVTQGNLSVPITLSYHASGIKVDQKASWVGLGWNLTSGGIITRTVKGHPDEFPFGYLDRGVVRKSDFLNIEEDDPWIDVFEAQEIERMIAGEWDSEPDEFTFNFPGASGKFFLDPNSQPFGVTQPYTDVKIEYETDESHPSGHITSFTITTPEGTIYKFGQPSATTYYPRYQLETVTSYTTWYLIEMRNANGADVINFTYQPIGNQAENESIETEYITFKYEYQFNGPSGYVGYEKAEKPNEIPYRYDGIKVIDEITFELGKIDFVTSDEREDGYGHKLASVDVYGRDKTTVIKSFDLGYGYFNSFGGKKEHYNKRLKLTSVTEIGTTENGTTREAKPPYEFSYLEEGIYQLPPRKSFSQDHWGYHNGKNNASLVPKYSLKDPNLPLQWINLGKADREPHPEYMKAGVIRRIKYPTKGYTEFEFQANTIKTTYTKRNVTPHPYNAAIQSNGGANYPSAEVFEYIPAEGDTLAANVNVLVEYFIQRGKNDHWTEGMMYVALEDVTGGQSGIGNELVSHNAHMYQAFSTQETLLAGHTYRLHVKSNIDREQDKGMAQIRVYWEESSTETITENKIVGGLRVKNIKNFDETGNPVTQKHFDYSHPDDSGFSSGIYNAYDLPDPGDYVNTSVLKYFIVNPNPGDPEGSSCKKYENTTKSLSYSLVHQRGIPIGDPVTYEYVTEYLYDYENATSPEIVGKSVYQYAYERDNVVFTTTPYNLDRSWLRGQLLKESHFAEDNVNSVKEVVYGYEVVENMFPPLTGTRISKTWTLGNESECYPISEACNCFPQTHLGDQQRNNMYLFTHYDQVFQWKRLKSITETLDGVTKTTTLFYEEDPAFTHSNVVAAEIENSNGETTRTEIRYAHETNNAELIARNMTGIPLESEVFVDGQLQGGSRLTFDHFGSLYLPKRYEERLSSGDYRLVSEIDEVNPKGRTTMSHTRDGIYSSILWGYNDELPKAKVINNALGLSTATFTSFHATAQPGVQTVTDFTIDFTQEVTVATTIDDVAGVIGSNPSFFRVYVEKAGESADLYAHNLPGSKSETLTLTPGTYYLKKYVNSAQTQNILTDMRIDFKASSMYYTSFEEADGVEDTDARTGQKVHNGNYTIEGDFLTEGTYLMSYWKYENGEWKLIEATLNHDGVTDITISATEKLDEVRIHPVGSQMQTNNFDPVQIRVVSQADVNSNSSLYNYDDLGRLITIQDKDKNIVQYNKYHYIE